MHGSLLSHTKTSIHAARLCALTSTPLSSPPSPCAETHAHIQTETNKQIHTHAGASKAHTRPNVPADALYYRTLSSSFAVEVCRFPLFVTSLLFFLGCTGPAPSRSVRVLWVTEEGELSIVLPLSHLLPPCCASPTLCPNSKPHLTCVLGNCVTRSPAH